MHPAPFPPMVGFEFVCGLSCGLRVPLHGVPKPFSSVRQTAFSQFVHTSLFPFSVSDLIAYGENSWGNIGKILIWGLNGSAFPFLPTNQTHGEDQKLRSNILLRSGLVNDNMHFSKS